jgi:Membrane bound beta barrel domain (DUF5777)
MTIRKIRLPIAWSLIAACILAFCLQIDAAAQMERKRANPGGPVDEVFMTPKVIIGSSVASLGAGNWNFTIMHVFGKLNGGVQSLWGLDDSANIRFGLDFGVSDRVSIGFGRSRFDKLYDFRGKWNVLRQTKDNSMPIEVALAGDVGVMTEANGFELVDRLNYFGSVMLARRLSDKISLQISGMVSHFNTVFGETDGGVPVTLEQNTHYALGFALRYLLNERISFLAEYMPVLGTRSTDTVDAFAVAVNFETGGHVFQLYLKTSQWLTEQHVIARNIESFFDGDIRFGFVINRVF